MNARLSIHCSLKRAVGRT